MQRALTLAEVSFSSKRQWNDTYALFETCRQGSLARWLITSFELCRFISDYHLQDPVATANICSVYKM